MKNLIPALESMVNPPAAVQQLMDRMKAAAAKPSPDNPREDPSVYSRATEESTNEITDAEHRLKGPLPISLKAWYQTISHVSFIGSHPALNPTKYSPDVPPSVYMNPATFQGAHGQQWKHQMESFGFKVQTEISVTPADENVLPDPLVIMQLEAVLGDFGEEDEDVVGPYMIAPDDLHKADISGDAYYIDLPDSSADVIFQDAKNDHFVAYLRRVFAWGGFPGWESHRDPPTKLIRELTDGLLLL